jgi:hypothetical protein
MVKQHFPKRRNMFQSHQARALNLSYHRWETYLVITLTVLALLLLASCGIGDVGSSESSNSVVAGNETQTGLSHCIKTCTPLADGTGWITQVECDGAIQEGPDFFSAEPAGCLATPAEEAPVE